MMNIDKFLNKVFLKDVFDLLEELPDKSVDMIYGDTDYKKSFADYIDWYIKLAKESLRVLKESGNMFLINYPKQNAYLRVKYLDDACYEVLDYVWIYNTNVGHSPY